MVKPRTIRKIYQEVTGLERFQLVVAADLRGDRLERDHLLKESRNDEFRLALRNAHALIRSYVAACGPSLGQLELLDRLQEPVAAFLKPLVPGLKPVPGEPAFLVMEVARDYAAEILRALEVAFAEACREVLGVEPEALLALFAPQVPGWLAPYERAIRAAEPEGSLIRDASANLRFAAGLRGAPPPPRRRASSGPTRQRAGA